MSSKTIKINNAANFSKEIEKLVIEKELHYIEALVLYAKEVNIELESIPKLLTQNLKSKIREEAETLHLLKKSGNKLDFLD